MLMSLLNRQVPESEWHKIPWNDPDFSRRMLNEHLDQSHDAASRRRETIEQHARFIHREILLARPSVILDLGCGPGLYTAWLSNEGHRCTGIDFGPASVAYAREHDSLSEYILGDLITADFGSGRDLIMLLYGELNAFAPRDARRIIEKAYHALKPGGRLLLEVHPESFVAANGLEPESWSVNERGLFSDSPYMILTESSYENRRSINLYHVIDLASCRVERYVTMLRAYTDEEYDAMLDAFDRIERFPSLTGKDEDGGDLFVLVAHKN